MFHGIEKLRCGQECVCERCNGIGRVTDEPNGQAVTPENQHLGTKACPRCWGGGKICKGHSTILKKSEPEKL
jgi:hypothetical protein